MSCVPRADLRRTLIGRWLGIVSVAAPSLLLCLASPACLSAESRAAENVIVLANSSVPGSIEVARHYAVGRGVPEANVIALPMPTTETIAWKDFVSAIWNPLEEDLVKQGWVDAIAMDLRDDIGRRKYAISGHKIAALVLCRGVPLRIDNDPALVAEVRPLTEHAELRTNRSSVDSELSLLANPNYSISAFVPNPLFGVENPSDAQLSQVVKVSRLDGPTDADAMHLADSAIEAERTGLIGRAYVDIAGPHDPGEHWLEETGAIINSLGYDLSIGHGPAVFPVSARFDAPALYFGWYTSDLTGPFELSGFRFPPGAIAMHIQSFSAQTLKSSTMGWCGPLVARGVTATVGNVFEPYLEYTHRPDMLMAALARGQDLVDAAYYALPVLSWQSIVVGDPLYRPFSVSLAAQVSNLQKLPPALSPYVVLRQMNLLDARGKLAESIETGKAALKDDQNLALAIGVAARVAASGNREEAIWLVKAAADAAESTPQNWDLLYESAMFLSGNGRGAEAVEVFAKLFASEGMPTEARRTWLAAARIVALHGGDTGQAAEWKQEIEKLPGGHPAP